MTGEMIVRLVLRAQSGDRVAFDALIREFRRMVMATVLQRIRNQAEAEDVSQEVFLRVFRTIGRFRGQSALRTWIYRIVINQARNRQRWWRRRHRSAQVSLDELEAVRVAALGRKGRITDAMKTLGSLTPDERRRHAGGLHSESRRPPREPFGPHRDRRSRHPHCRSFGGRRIPQRAGARGWRRLVDAREAPEGLDSRFATAQDPAPEEGKGRRAFFSNPSACYATLPFTRSRDATLRNRLTNSGYANATERDTARGSRECRGFLYGPINLANALIAKREHHADFAGCPLPGNAGICLVNSSSTRAADAMPA